MRSGGLRWVAPCAAALGLAGCARWDAIDLATLPRPEQFPDAVAVVLLDDVAVDFHLDAISGDAVADVEFTRRARILREAGASVAKVSVHYDPVFSPIVAFQARTIAPGGSVRTFGRG